MKKFVTLGSNQSNLKSVFTVSGIDVVMLNDINYTIQHTVTPPEVAATVLGLVGDFLSTRVIHDPILQLPTIVLNKREIERPSAQKSYIYPFRDEEEKRRRERRYKRHRRV